MAVAYSNVDKAFTGSVIKFPESSQEVKEVNRYIASVQEFKKNCNDSDKSVKKLLKQYNEIVANTKKTEKAIACGQLNHTINQHIVEQFVSAKKDLKQAIERINNRA